MSRFRSGASHRKGLPELYRAKATAHLIGVPERILEVRKKEGWCKCYVNGKKVFESNQEYFEANFVRVKV
jgi:hypothetical protein